MRLGSLFDGIGGALLCAVNNGIEPVWASEIEPFPIMVTAFHFPQVKHLGDITKINGAEIEPVDIIVGGSPCQDLSVAGKRAGLAGARSGLFMEQIRIIKEMRLKFGADKPRFMVWENVPGAFSSNSGEDFRAVLEETARVADGAVSIPRSQGWSNAGSVLGDGFSISWRTLDAQYWGVPQRRRRIYLVADFGGQSAPEILFERESVSGHIAESRSKGQGTAGDAESGVGSASPSYCIDHVVTTGGNCTAQGPCYKEEMSFTLKAAGTHAVCYGISAYESNSMNSSNPHSGIYKAYGTLQNRGTAGGFQGCVKPGNTQTVRRLTPLECERLQGYPDGWTNIPGASDSARYKALGNSFAIPCADFVIRRCGEVFT